MKRLLHFLFYYKNGILFLLLELISVLLIYSGPAYQPTKQINSSYSWIGNTYAYITKIKSYPLLNKAYSQLLHENGILKEQLIQKDRELGANQLIAASTAKQYQAIPARIINNSIINTKNYLTIDKGAKHGITPGMGVISEPGIVGYIKAVSEQFATITSLLHTDMLVSAKIERSGVMGTIRWSGNNPFQVQLLYVPRHIQVEIGDTIVTSGYNSAFYEGVFIGQVKQVELKKEASFYTILVDLSNDFSRLQHVYIIKNTLQQEKDSLEAYTKNYYE